MLLYTFLVPVSPCLSHLCLVLTSSSSEDAIWVHTPLFLPSSEAEQRHVDCVCVEEHCFVFFLWLAPILLLHCCLSADSRSFTGTSPAFHKDQTSGEWTVMEGGNDKFSLASLNLLSEVTPNPCLVSNITKCWWKCVAMGSTTVVENLDEPTQHKDEKEHSPVMHR